MKRLTYISTFARPLSNKEIEEIGERSVRNNTRDGLTGVLFCFNGIFYQILEGPEDALNRCYTRILKDSRHKDIFCLEVENITNRQFGDWAMKTVRLDESEDSLIRPIRSMLNSLARTHYVLERYSPREVLRGLQNGENPLDWRLKDNERAILFADIFSSTTLAENLPPADFERLLGIFYDIANRSVVENGGTISKLTGDGLMAYYPRGREAEALNTALEICRRLDDVRSSANETDPAHWLYAGIGLCTGIVREGNIGSDFKLDYTLIGDAVNSAARLQSLTRKVDYLVVFDDSLLKKIESPSALRKLGLYQPKGKTENLYVYSVDYPYTRRKISVTELKSTIVGLRKQVALP